MNHKAFTLIELLVSLRQESDKLWMYALELARPEGFEPTTLGLENRCSIKNPLKTNIRH